MKKSLIALAFGTLALGMSEFVMMGILPDIARSLGVSIPEAGHLISAYALGVCFGAPLTVLVARTRPLKQILLALTALIAVGNLCASLAPNYWMLMAMRFVSGLPHGAFFGVGSIVAERVADAGKRTEAVSIMIVGMTVANLFGVPLGTYISNVLSWRTTFAIVAVWGVVALTLVRMWVPRMEPLPDTGLKGQFRFLRSLAPWLVLASVMLGNGGIFCCYSYVSPLMIHTSGFTEENLTLIIMLAGFGMFAGNILGGHLSDRFTPEKVVRFTLAAATLTLLGIFFGAHVPYLSVMLMTLCTGCLFCVSSPQQLLILENSRGGEMLGAALVQVAFNLGNALGAYCGACRSPTGWATNIRRCPVRVSPCWGCWRPWFISVNIPAMRSDNGAELFPVVDEAGNVMGAATRAQCHGGGMLLHPVVHLHLFNSRGELYLQRRPVWKDIQPGRWDTAVGGHVDYGETVDDALRREVREELGVTGFVPERVAVYVFRSERERELIYVHRTVYDGEVVPSDELDGGRFWSRDEIFENLGKGVFTPNFEGEVELVLGV